MPAGGPNTPSYFSELGEPLRINVACISPYSLNNNCIRAKRGAVFSQHYSDLKVAPHTASEIRQKSTAWTVKSEKRRQCICWQMVNALTLLYLAQIGKMSYISLQTIVYRERNHLTVTFAKLLLPRTEEVKFVNL